MRVSPAVKSISRAFTLVELMVSMSVLSMLVFIYGSLFNSASHAWITGGGNAERRRNARALTDYIASELKGAMLPVQTVDASGKGNLQFVINPPGDTNSSTYRNADCIFWQAPLATETTYGDIAEVGYFVKWDDSISGEPRPLLCRFFVNPSDTADSSDVSRSVTPNPHFLIFDHDPTRWMSSTEIEAAAPATKAGGYAGVFGENVVGLWVRSYGLDGQELPRTFDSRKGYACQFTKITMNNGSPSTQSWSEQRYLPAKVQVSIAQVDSHYAERLPAASTVLRTLVSSGSIHDAKDFLQAFRQQAAGSAPLARLLPGLRIYSTEVQLSNAQ